MASDVIKHRLKVGVDWVWAREAPPKFMSGTAEAMLRFKQVIKHMRNNKLDMTHGWRFSLVVTRWSRLT